MHTLSAKLSFRWLFLGLANLCANATAYEMAHTVQLDEAGLAQPQPEAKLGQRRPVGARSMAAVFLSISAALLVTFVMLQCFRFLQRSENNDFLARRLAKGGEDPCKGDEEKEKKKKPYIPYIPYMLDIEKIKISELRKYPIYNQGEKKPIQNRLTEDQLMEFWTLEPNDIIPEESDEGERFGGYTRSELYAPDMKIGKVKLSELRRIPIQTIKDQKEIQGDLTENDLLRFWLPRDVLEEEEDQEEEEETQGKKEEHYYAGIPASRLYGPALRFARASPGKMRQTTIRARGIRGPVQSAFSDQELIDYWRPEEVLPDPEGEPKEAEYAGFKQSELYAPDLRIQAASMKELRAMTIRAKGVDEPVQNRFSDADLIRFWKPERILFDDEEEEEE